MRYARIAWNVLFAMALGTLFMSCASTPNGRSASDAARFRGFNGDAVTGSELRAEPESSLLTALEAVRPHFLRSRGSTPAVSIDGSPPTTDLSVLRWIQVGEVREVRLVRGAGRSGVAAVQPDGSIVVGDLILVTTRRGPD